jgi:pyruvate/2-oxoglutarate dehydrogenase complex dihydrolipoamide dehydrogenase (E3) component
MERLRRLRAGISPHDSAERYRGLGVDVHFGQATFVARDALEVAGQTLRFGRCIIATGGRAAVPDVPGLADAGYFTNETIFTLTALPPRLAVIGAGPIGCELAQAFARLGATVTLIGSHAQILPKEDQDAAEIVQRSLERDGVQMLLGARPTRVESVGEEKRLTVERAGRGEAVLANAILVAVGRRPNVDGLGLEAAGVEYDPRDGVVVNDRLRTGNRRIFAAGDVCSQYRFTHAADALARIAIQNALFFGRARASRLVMPWCTYTDPEVAHVGLTEHDARDQGIAVDTFTQPLSGVDRAILDGETEGFVRVHVHRGTDRLIGGTIVARHAGETIGELTLAMTAGRGLKSLAGVIHPYPTQAEGIKRVADAYNRTRLRPWVKKLLENWFAWRQ